MSRLTPAVPNGAGSAPGEVHDIVVGYNFAPSADASAITAAKRLVQRGRRAVVVSQDLSAFRRRDASLERLVAPFLAEHLLTSGEVAFNRWSSVRSFAREGTQRVARSRHLPGLQQLWSRSMWPHSHVLAAALKTRYGSLTWTAEFSDPLRREVDGRPRPSAAVARDETAASLLAGVPGRGQAALQRHPDLMSWAELLPLLLADRLVFTNDNQRDAMLGHVDDDWLREHASARSSVDPHPTLPGEYYGRPGPERRDGAPTPLRIGYFGTFYANRGLGEVLEALGPARRWLGTPAELHVFTDDTTALRTSSAAGGVDDLVRTHGPVDYLDSLQLMTHFDALLVNDVAHHGYPDGNPYLPSKLSDYLGAEVPVIGLVQQGSPLDHVDGIHRVRIGDVGGLVRVLRGLR